MDEAVTSVFELRKRAAEEGRDGKMHFRIASPQPPAWSRNGKSRFMKRGNLVRKGSTRRWRCRFRVHEKVATCHTPKRQRLRRWTNSFISRQGGFKDERPNSPQLLDHHGCRYGDPAHRPPLLASRERPRLDTDQNRLSASPHWPVCRDCR